ncbi:helix-turn-helix domain-containing protein [Mesorhizobium sp. B2-5-9]|nr:helix-turn-helix domain-containing protein [Mesorhizobium sp. B2-5-9]
MCAGVVKMFFPIRSTARLPRFTSARRAETDTIPRSRSSQASLRVIGSSSKRFSRVRFIPISFSLRREAGQRKMRVMADPKVGPDAANTHTLKHPNVYSPRSLAVEWGCSEHHIRNLINRGQLRAWRLGGKLLRIDPQDVAEFKRGSVVIDASTHQSPMSETRTSDLTRIRAARLDMPPKLKPLAR